jgi:uncharacterized glyoxalase superfamily protein PhnB
MIQVEHVAWQVKDPVAVANWYGKHLGFRVIRKVEGGPNTHFLADAAGRVVVEIYNNPAASILDYPAMHPLQLHVAFAVQDPAAERDRLLDAGAKIAEDLVTTPAGDQLVMLKDPFGFSIQLCKRARAMI